jgi:hypothetical protein
MSEEIELTEAWVNLDYGANMNRLAPELNPASPGRPYFVGVEGAAPGQWVRIVCRASDGAVFWCVGHLVEVLDGAIRVRGIGYEAGDPAPRWFLEARWTASLELQADKNWYVVELEQE